MNSYTVDKWIRYAMASLAFAMVLILTPRALLDVSSEVDSHEIPVDMLEPADDCLWCSPQEWEQADPCDDDYIEHRWVNPDELPSHDESTPCLDEFGVPDYS